MLIVCTLNKCIVLYLYTYEVIMYLLNIPLPLAPLQEHHIDALVISWLHMNQTFHVSSHNMNSFSALFSLQVK